MNNETRTAYNNIQESSITFPWLSYDCNRQPAPVYVYLDLRDGEITVDTGTRGSCSVDEFNNLIFSFEISPYSTFDFINDFINDNLPAFQKILDITFCDWASGNYRGRLIGERTWFDDVQQSIDIPYPGYYFIADEEDLINNFQESGKVTPSDFAEQIESAKGPDFIVNNEFDADRIIEIITENIIQTAKNESYGVDDGSFAEACVNQNTLEELITALCNEPDETDLKNWGIDAKKWEDQIKAAIAELSE